MSTKEKYLAIKLSDLELMSGAKDPSSGRSEVECLLRSWLDGRDIEAHYLELPKPAQQHQGVPVAWVRFRSGEPDYDGDACMIMNVPGDTLGDGDSWEPVYTHPDTRVAGYALTIRELNKEHASEVCSMLDKLAEVERLHERMLTCEEIAENNAKAFAEASIKLAEAQALLRDLDDAWNSHDGREWFGKLMQKAESLLASAEPSAPKCTHRFMSLADSPRRCADCDAVEPSAPVEIDERAEFEAWFKDHSKDWPFPSESIKCISRDNDWLVWQARAALARKP